MDCVDKLKIKKISNVGAVRVQSQSEFVFLNGVIYGLDYAENPQIQEALKQFKYKFTKELADYFGNLMADKLRELSMTKNRNIILIPVPLHKKRLNYRGFNQAELLSDSVAEKIVNNISVIPLLKRVRNTSQQAKLNKKERGDNLKNAFVLESGLLKESGLQNPVYFIVDDVCTTGSTLENCAKVLKDAGITRVYGLVVARAFK